MKVFVTGATGFIGSAIVQELLSAGHQVLGLSRNEASDRVLTAAGAEPHRGDLTNLDSIKSGTAGCDGVIHTAFNHEFTRTKDSAESFRLFKESSANDKQVIEAMGEVLVGTDRPLVITSAIGLLPKGRLVNEADMPAPGPNPRIASEEAADLVAARGVCVSVVRLSPSVHGAGDTGFVPTLINIARKTGLSVYDSESRNRWPSVHRLDAARLYRLALETPSIPGTRFHAVAEEGIAFQQIAEAVAMGLDVPAIGKTKDEAAAHFGSFAHFAAMDIHVSSAKTQELLGWKPEQPGLLEDLKGDIYFEG